MFTGMLSYIFRQDNQCTVASTHFYFNIQYLLLPLLVDVDWNPMGLGLRDLLIVEEKRLPSMNSVLRLSSAAHVSWA